MGLKPRRRHFCASRRSWRPWRSCRWAPSPPSPSRVGQYGFTPERVIATVCVLVAAGYALGHGAAAALSRKTWLKLIERVNIAMAVAILAAILALFTPLADPARISVDSQVARLTGGGIAPDRFDYDFLRFKAGQFGKDALTRLAALRGSARDADIAARAAIAQMRQFPEGTGTEDLPVSPLEDRLKVYCRCGASSGLS